MPASTKQPSPSPQTHVSVPAARVAPERTERTPMLPSILCTPRDLLQLQQALGNRAVTRLVARASPAHGHTPLQRKLVNGMMRPQSAQQVLTSLQNNFVGDYNQWIRAGETNASLIDHIQPYVQDSDTTYRTFELVPLLHSTIKVARFVGDYTIPGQDGIDVKLWQTTGSFPGGLDKAIHPGGASHIDTKVVSLMAEVAVDGLPEAVQQWDVGFVQTVTSLHRAMTIAHNNGIVQQQRTDLAGPTRDGPSGYNGPWFDPTSMQALTTPRVPVTVKLLDRPGTSWGLQATAVGANITGRDTFKTWLVVRHRGDQRTIFLRMWTWAVDYSGPGVVGGTETADNGASAVLTGPVGKDAFLISPWDNHHLPDHYTYAHMKKAATNTFTPLSGMMPTDTYHDLVQQFSMALTQGDFTTAIIHAQTIQTNLLLMEGKGKRYWKSATLKAQYFTPILQAVQKMIHYVQGL